MTLEQAKSLNFRYEEMLREIVADLTLMRRVAWEWTRTGSPVADLNKRAAIEQRKNTALRHIENICGDLLLYAGELTLEAATDRLKKPGRKKK